MDATPLARTDAAPDRTGPDADADADAPALAGAGPSGREAVLAAAAEAFMERGFAAASIDDVAQRMGATKGRVYHYWRSKLDLFVDVVRASLEMIGAETAAAAEAAGPDPADRLAAMTRAHLASILRDRAFHRCATQGVEMHLQAATTPAQRRALAGLVALRDRHQRMFERTLADGIAAGAFRDCDVKTTTRTLLAAINGPVAWYRAREGETEADRARLADSIAAFALAGVAAHDDLDKKGRTP